MKKKRCIPIWLFTNSRFALGSKKPLHQWPAHSGIPCINYYEYTCIGVSKLRWFLKARDPTQVKRTYIELNSDSSFSILLSTHHR